MHLRTETQAEDGSITP